MRRRRDASKAPQLHCEVPFEVRVLALGDQWFCGPGIVLCVSRVSARERTDSQVLVLCDDAVNAQRLEVGEE